MNEISSATGAATGAITRDQLERVVRRATELAMSAGDADERISEDEVVRIAGELGLPARAVKQALYELPASEAQPSLGERILQQGYGPGTIIVARAVPGDADVAFRKLEEYLTTREYLRARRRQPGSAWFAPADDRISTFLRAFNRPARRHYVARARGVLLDVRPLETGWAHVRIELDISSRRNRWFRGGLIGGAGVGVPLAVAAAIAVESLAGPVIGPTAGILAGAASLVLAIGGMSALAASRSRAHIENARIEVGWLLDRLEQGEPLEPPAVPWRRRIAGAR